MSATRHDRFEGVYRDHHPAVRAYLLRRAEPELAQDALSETFLAAWRRLDELPARYFEEELDRLPIGRRRTLVRRALAGLSERDREVLMLVAWEGLDPAGAARVAGCTRATFAVRLHRARKRLDRALFALEFPSPAPTDQALEVR